MNTYTLTKTRLVEGVWEGQLTRSSGTDAQPDIEVTHLDRALDGIGVIRNDSEGVWTLRVPIPAEVIADGVQTFVIRERRTGEVLNSFALMAGDVLAHDIRVEMALLREELDLLKRAFRRHCLEAG